MNFTNLMNLVFNNLHTILLLVGLILVVAAIAVLTNTGYTLLAAGFVFIAVSFLIMKGGEMNE